MLIVGERINTSRKSISEAAKTLDASFILKEARNQIEAGAHMIDVNAGTFAEREKDHLMWLVETIRTEIDAPLCIDTTDPEVAGLALHICGPGAMVNSITAEKETYAAMLPLVKEHKCKVIALCIDNDGIPAGLEERLKVGSGLVDSLLSERIPVEDIYVDPLVMAVSTDRSSGDTALRAIREIRNQYPGIHTICGLSNISFGLPVRKFMNRMFLVAAMTAGLDAVILDPLDAKMMANLIAVNALLGRDEYCSEYIAAYRAPGVIVDKPSFLNR
jgi:5-methyltetrahydrofolate--homocysteine methyltransferase